MKIDCNIIEELAGTNTTRTMRKCTYTNELEVVGEDGLTDPERKQHE